jgi:NADH-quinone oxidoreductase subunit F
MTRDTVRPLMDAEENLFHLEVYRRRGGYESARKALDMAPADVMAEVRKAELRGRGGAGFPAGVKWGFIRRDGDKPVYLCVNADEGEPGTFKDRWLMTHEPHLLLEGILITAYAVGAGKAFVYIRGEYEGAARRLEEAAAEAREAGFFGERIFGKDFGLEVVIHRGAGAYICGEETALLESLEGKRGEPRLKPPFPASIGLFGAPTVVNNVETLCNIPRIIGQGGEAFAAAGRPADGGTRLFGVSGAVRRPGLYELPIGTPLRELVYTRAGGPAEGTSIKGVIPGGLSAPILSPDELDLPLECSAFAGAGTMIGSGAVIVIGSNTSMLEVLGVMTRFYDHESCGQCTPCRIGTSWMRKTVVRLAAGGGGPRDLDEIVRVAAAIKGRTFCPLGDAAALPVIALVGKFRAELEERAAEGAARKKTC